MSSPTQLLYYEDAYLKEFQGTILKVHSADDRHGVVLDRTAFYPTGGGQPGDTGTLKEKNTEVEVVDVQWKKGSVHHILNNLDEKMRAGKRIRGLINWGRRYALMRNHTAAHIMGEAVRRATEAPLEIVGSTIAVDKARLDFAYGKSLRPLFPEIEEAANHVVREDRNVVVRMMDRQEAEKYVERFHESLSTLPPQVHEVRIVEIKEWHACACGGTHVRRTGELEKIKLLKRVSKGKGVERLEFTAGTQ